MDQNSQYNPNGNMYGPPQPQQPQQPQPGQPQPFPPQQPYGGSNSAPAKPNNKKTTIIIVAIAATVVLALVAVVLIILLTGKPSTPQEESKTSNPGSSQEEDDSTSTGEQSASETKKTINQTITDAELGYTITVKQAIFNIPFNESDGYNQAEYKKSVAVEVTVANNSEYYNAFSASDLELTINGQSHYHSEYEFSEYISANNLTKLPSATSQGNSSTGWLFFSYDKDVTDTLTFTYDRSAATTTDDKTIPAKKFNIDLN